MHEIKDRMNRGVSGDTREQEFLLRRVVLRGALAVGCSLGVPTLLSGCGAKQDTASTSSTLAGSSATGTPPGAPAASRKVTQASVQYQHQPKGDQKCSGCMHFNAESNTCQLVEGQISPDGWCTLWAGKA